jgi:hypothetical protein
VARCRASGTWLTCSATAAISPHRASQRSANTGIGWCR